MKKIYLYAGVAAAAMTACTDELGLENGLENNGSANGIVFESSADGTRGMMNKKDLNFFWFAESDEVNVYALNTTANNEDVATPVAKTYKATVSEANGRFTATDASNLISFLAGGKKMDAILAYNATVTNIDKWTVFPVIAPGKPGYDEYIKNTRDIKDFTMNVVGNTAQAHKVNEVVAPMYGVKLNASQENYYNSVGENIVKLDKSFTRMFPVVGLTGVKGNDDYMGIFGNLNTVTIEAKGIVYDKALTDTEGYAYADQTAAPVISGTNYVATSAIAGTAATFKTSESGKNAAGYTVNKATVTGASNTITYTLSEKWNAADELYISVYPVSRTLTATDKPSISLKENIDVTYDFANVSLKKTFEEDAAWNVEHGVYDSKYVLDIAKDFPWIVTNSGNIDPINMTPDDSSDDLTGRVLLVNSGSVADAFKKLSNGTLTGDILWSTGDVAHTQFKEVIIGAGVNPLTSDDWKALQVLKGDIEKITILNGLTKVTNNDLGKFTKLAYINLANVTEVTSGAFNTSAVSPKAVIMPSYDFSTSKTLTAEILKPAALQVLDMSGVASMKEMYPKDGMSLQDFVNLTDVTIQPGVILGPESFKGDVKLVNIKANGGVAYVTLGGYGAFEGCTTLASVNVDGTKIYTNTFSGATALTTVNQKDGKTPIKPVIVQDKAFANTKANVDLTATDEIGVAAFQNNTALKGVHNDTKNIDRLSVAAKTVGANAFEGCTALRYVDFTNLTKLELDILTSTTLTELKFVNVVSFPTNTVYTSAMFGNPANTKLFVNPSQKYNAQDIQFTVYGVPYSIQFKTIVEE